MFPETILNSGSCLLSALVLLPLVGALALFILPIKSAGANRSLALVFGLLEFFLALLLLKGFDSATGKFQFTENIPWVSNFGINYLVGVDGISILLIVLTTLLTSLVLLASTSIHEKLKAYLACILILETGIIGAFVALDTITFYVFWELMLIPMYFLIGVWGGSRRIYAAIKFVLFTASGSLLMLVAIVYLGMLHAQQFGHLSFYVGDWTKLSLSSNEQFWLFAAFALAFAIKVPIFPLHTWLPDAHVEAPTGGSVILAGILLKMGLYGLIRFALPVFPHAVINAAPLLAFLGVTGIVFGALVAWVQTDMKKLVAYSSVSHLGFCVLGFAALSQEGMQGCILQMLNHGVSTAALFFIVGVVYDRKHTRLIADYGGLVYKAPVFAFLFLIFTLSSVGLPLTNGFIGEFLILFAGFKYSSLLGVIAVSGVVLGAMYMLSLYRRVIFGGIDLTKNEDLADVSFREKLVFVPLLLLVFWMGLLPQMFLRQSEASAALVLESIKLPAVASIDLLAK